MASKKTQCRTIDLEEVVMSWAQRQYNEDAGFRMRCLKKMKRIEAHIDWSRVMFINETAWEHLDVVPIEEKTGVKDGDSNANLAIRRLQGAAAASEVGNLTKSRVLFKTIFRNNTESDQDYTMRTEKTTRSSCTTSMETAYTKGIDMCVTLKTPCEVFEANAGFHSELSLTKAEGETLEEELTWGVESHVKVKQGYLANAMLVVEEIKYNGSFVIISTVRGRVSVTFTNTKDNNSQVYSIASDIVDIVRDYVEEQRPINKSIDQIIDVQDSVLVIRTKGSCDFRFGIQQQVLVDQMPIPKTA